MFTPIRTERLLIRPFRLDDVGAFVAWRNDPDVARYQDWLVPYSMEQAEKTVSELIQMEGPKNKEWWMAVVADPDTDEPMGELAVHLTWERRTAEVGYTLAKAQWGKGYAVEALTALVEYLFEDVGVSRQFGMLHPDNPASAMVLERTGFVFEGHTRLSFWLGDDVSDDWIYGLTRPDWDKWRNRKGQSTRTRGTDRDHHRKRADGREAVHPQDPGVLCGSDARIFHPRVVSRGGGRRPGGSVDAGDRRRRTRSSVS